MARQSKGIELERAARANKLRDPNHPLLRELDEVAARVTALAEELHPARWSLGLIQPDNVFAVEMDLEVPAYGLIGLEEEALVSDDGAQYLSNPQRELWLLPRRG